MNTDIQKLAVTGTFLGCILLICTCLTLTANIEPAYGAENQAKGSPSTHGTHSKANLGECHVSQQFPESILQWCSLITEFAEKHDFSPNLIAALVWLESGGNPLAYSRSGAVGLMQVMPRDGLAANFACANGPCFASRPTIEELQDPQFNVEYGTQMLAGLQQRLGSLRDALKAYGPMDAGYTYADRVLSIYETHKE